MRKSLIAISIFYLVGSITGSLADEERIKHAQTLAAHFFIARTCGFIVDPRVVKIDNDYRRVLQGDYYEGKIRAEVSESKDLSEKGKDRYCEWGKMLFDSLNRGLN